MSVLYYLLIIIYWKKLKKLKVKTLKYYAY